MPKTPRQWLAKSAWPDEVRPGHYGRQGQAAKVRIELLDDIGLSTLIVQDGRFEQFSAFVADRWGFKVPDTGRAAFRDGQALVWSAPDQWLAVATTISDLDDLPEKLAGIAGVTEQGDGRALLMISGSAATRTLQKGLAIDLDAAAFRAGSTAVAALMHLSVQIWQLDDSPSYILSIPRTVAGSVWEWLTSSAAEYGYEVVAATSQDRRPPLRTVA